MLTVLLHFGVAQAGLPAFAIEGTHGCFDFPAVRAMGAKNGSVYRWVM